MIIFYSSVYASSVYACYFFNAKYFLLTDTLLTWLDFY